MTPGERAADILRWQSSNASIASGGTEGAMRYVALFAAYVANHIREAEIAAEERAVRAVDAAPRLDKVRA